jgi:hypothetical protein
MNTNVVALHNSSPFSLFFARKFNGFHNFTNDQNELLSHEQLLDRLKYMTKIVFPAIDQKSKEIQRQMVDRFNATVLNNEFPDGAKVMTLDPITNNKLTPKYEGPYIVVRRTAGGSYELKDGTGATLSRNYTPSQLKLVLDDFKEQTYEIEKIIDHRPDSTQTGKFEYKVKWKGFSEEENSWEPEDNFIERKCIRTYWDNLQHKEDLKDQPYTNIHKKYNLYSKKKN